uniref:Uncharacterized protein n=1 Tax=Lepeophtheirus salmonis TaxID=72036 RepID=A0A0K2TGZ4_LEPSM
MKIFKDLELCAKTLDFPYKDFFHLWCLTLLAIKMTIISLLFLINIFPPRRSNKE